MKNNGRPEYTEDQYRTWLGEMAPFLKLGCSLYWAMDRASLLRHKDSIYRKFKLNDWFCEKIEAFQRYPGEILNNIFSRLILIISEKVKYGLPISNEELQNLRFYANRHRSCHEFFTTKREILGDKRKKVWDRLISLEINNDESRYEEVARKAKLRLEQIK
jgi:hypothetical protein